MYSVTLRSRKDWAPAVPILARSLIGGWKETELTGCDVAFPTDGSINGPLFRAILLSATEAHDGAQTATRIERLRNLDGGRRVGIILLLDGDHSMTAFAKLELELLKSGSPLPVIPISKADELPACLADWRRQMSQSVLASKPHETPKTLVSHCALGKPLAERQANILMDVMSGFRELAHCVHDPKKLEQLESYLGRRDAARIMAFLRGESRSADGW